MGLPPRRTASESDARSSQGADQEELCPVCLEEHSDLVSLACSHRLCRHCWDSMHAAGLTACPLCRQPLLRAQAASSSAAPVEPTRPSWYVLLQGPPEMSPWLGAHHVTWMELETRVGLPAQWLVAGTLKERGIQLRLCPDMEAAQRWWQHFRLPDSLADRVPVHY